MEKRHCHTFGKKLAEESILLSFVGYAILRAKYCDYVVARLRASISPYTRGLVRNDTWAKVNPLPVFVRAVTVRERGGAVTSSALRASSPKGEDSALEFLC